MKDILFIGGPKTVQGVARIDDDLVSILSVEGLYDRKAVVVWPTADFLSVPAIEADLRPFVGDCEEGELVGEAITRAVCRLAKLILAVSGGQNLVAVIDKDAPVYALCWTGFIKSWTACDSKEIRSCKSHDAGYGVLSAVKSFPWAFKVTRAQSGQAGDLIPKYHFQLFGHNVTIGLDSLFDVLESHGAEVELTYPVSDRLSSARAVKVSTDQGYMLVVPEPDKIRNFVIGLKTAPVAKPKAEEGVAPKASKVNTDRYMTRKDVAELLNATTRTVDRYIDSGKLESTKVGSKVLILKSSVDALLE